MPRNVAKQMQYIGSHEGTFIRQYVSFIEDILIKQKKSQYSQENTYVGVYF